MELGLGGLSALSHCPWPRRQTPLGLSAQPALWPTLAALALLSSVAEASLGPPPPGSRPISQPCCRPTRYEAVSFMDVNSTWRTVDRLSATACGCLG
ncbi:PREDICTED: artemin [Mandrillus leucophaeus]|uniref:artemin n=1 Tax=Mandrillus leucophaeus TaxID=9568 RepID=UPI0005F51A83|nr:PREDICTED: artemin [Mandrillus leucophaeus]